jgi:hypothetical protein
LIRFEIPTVINLSQVAGDSNGAFTPDDQMPGIPGATSLDDGIAAEILTFVELSKGILTLGVNSDDGFRAQAGYLNKLADAVLLGEFDGPRGPSDTLLTVVVEEAGVYPIRVIMQASDGGASIEIFSLTVTGIKTLINDVANGGYKAYRTGVAPDKPLPLPTFTLTAKLAAGQIELTWTELGVVLQESADLGSWATIAGATSPYRTAASKARNFYRLRKQ